LLGKVGLCLQSHRLPSNGLLKRPEVLQMLAIPSGIAVLGALQAAPIDHFLPNDFANRPNIRRLHKLFFVNFAIKAWAVMPIETV
jgi:hypothetical protein